MDVFASLELSSRLGDNATEDMGARHLNRRSSCAGWEQLGPQVAQTVLYRWRAHGDGEESKLRRVRVPLMN